MLAPWKKSYGQPGQHIKKQRHYFANKGPSSQGYGFSIGHVWMWELDYKESWALKNWCFWTMVLEKTLESPLDCKEIQLVHPKGYQSWVFIGRTDIEAEVPILWPPDAKDWLTGKDPDAGKDWRWEEKGTTEDEMVGWPSPIRWTWVWVNSGSWWWTRKPGVLQSMGSQSVGHSWATELTELLFAVFYRVLVPLIAPLRFLLLAVVLLSHTIMKLLADFIIHIDDLSTILLLIPLTFSLSVSLTLYPEPVTYSESQKLNGWDLSITNIYNLPTISTVNSPCDQHSLFASSLLIPQLQLSFHPLNIRIHWPASLLLFLLSHAFTFQTIYVQFHGASL